jgi:hypothetical protein
MKWRSERRGTKEAAARNETIASKLDEAKARHKAWVREQFPNKDDVIRGARDLVDEFEERQGLKPGTVMAIFDDHGARLGYFLRIQGRNVDTHELVERIKSETGEWFEIDRVL